MSFVPPSSRPAASAPGASGSTAEKDKAPVDPRRAESPPPTSPAEVTAPWAPPVDAAGRSAVAARAQEDAGRAVAQQGQADADAAGEALERREESTGDDRPERPAGQHGEPSGAQRTPREEGTARRNGGPDASLSREASGGRLERDGDALARSGSQAGDEPTKPDGPPDAWRRAGPAGARRAGAVAAEVSTTGYARAPVPVTGPKLAAPVDRPEKLPDALTLLKEAKEGGVLFHEDREGELGTFERDPALAEAVEECIRQCFGIRGVLRVGPGHDEAGVPVIVVTAAPGLTDVGFGRIPAQVLGFTTLVAIPFDVLPLRRES